MKNCFVTTLVGIWMVVSSVTGNPVEKMLSDNFTKIDFCAVLTPNKVVILRQVTSCNPNSGVTGESLCAKECLDDPLCRHFNYKRDTQSCEMFYNDQSCFVSKTNCNFFQVSKTRKLDQIKSHYFACMGKGIVYEICTIEESF